MMIKKRPSPASLSTAAATAGGFTLLPLPPSPPPQSLRRCSSAPIDAADIPNSGVAPPPPPPQAQSPESIIGSGSRPPLPRSPLLRTVSDPNPFLSPPNQMPLQSPNSGETGSESPASKRLKRMSERMREMKQWFDELIQENDQDSASEHNDDETEEINEKKNGELERDETKEKEETVSAEREGDAINVRFKCPCGNSYHILLMGQDCYYKLL